MLIKIKNTKTFVTVRGHETKLNVKKQGVRTISVINPKKLDTVVTVTPTGAKTVTNQSKLTNVTVVERGLQGIPGISAYQHAVNEGFQGSLSEWLESLRGENGIDGVDGRDGQDGADGKDGVDGKDGLDGKDGVDGKDGLDGKDGIDGKSAYELALAEGFQGSLSEWLETLKGKDGVDGKDGIDGKDGLDGKDGKDGKDGLSAYQVAEIYGFTGSEQEWLESLKGADGKDGKDGKDGRDGVDGADGVDGKDGRDGIDAQYYDENGPITNVKTFVTTLSVSNLSDGSFSVDYSHVGFSRILNVQVSAEASGENIADRRLVFISHNSVTTTGFSGVLLSSTSAGLLAAMALVTADNGKIHITVVGV